MPVAATGVGLLWSVLSLIASVLNSVGFYSPYWLRGTSFNRTQVTFGSFRRCVYPRLGEDGDWVMVYECGRYTTFSDIPSVSWQIVTVAVGVGSAISLLAAFTAIASCCISDVLTKSTARILGMIQLLAATAITIGCVIYPNGWSSREIKDACGDTSDAYRLGSCNFSWSIYLLASGVILLVICSALSFKAAPDKLPYRI
ncbi:LHFPL tetraspan subfamily member 6 protein-like isoform X1 [Centruroides vittatus]|uniref:LHFPL tetraspan subfamily member 6 protein-like isoform X1 n=1 Tax=Centruroides vittatus TaxID=120091 RepID=UPI0035100AF5